MRINSVVCFRVFRFAYIRRVETWPHNMPWIPSYLPHMTLPSSSLFWTYDLCFGPIPSLSLESTREVGVATCRPFSLTPGSWRDVHPRCIFCSHSPQRTTTLQLWLGSFQKPFCETHMRTQGQGTVIPVCNRRAEDTLLRCKALLVFKANSFDLL